MSDINTDESTNLSVRPCRNKVQERLTVLPWLAEFTVQIYHAWANHKICNALYTNQ